MRPAVLLLAVPALCSPIAHGRSRKPPEPVPVPTVDPEPAPPPPPPTFTGLFADGLPLEIGPVPEGLGSVSAQGCAACHYEAYTGWRASSHASAHARPAYREAVRAAADPACLQCHLPLGVQHADIEPTGYEGSDAVALVPNPDFDATLSTEGVTCAACHVRDGLVIGPDPGVTAPHPVVRSEELTSSIGCAACHQLVWPGADRPFYDTYGEWERSAYAAAGVGCPDCHIRAAADPSDSEHGHSFASGPVAASLLVDLGHPSLTRGAPPIAVGLTLQNTGAGHSFPTGTPYEGVRLVAELVGQDRNKPVVRARFTADLARKLSAGPPWTTLEDTRLGPGESREWTHAISLSQADPPGPWTLSVRLVRLSADGTEGETLQRQDIPISVD